MMDIEGPQHWSVMGTGTWLFKFLIWYSFCFYGTYFVLKRSVDFLNDWLVHHTQLVAMGVIEPFPLPSTWSCVCLLLFRELKPSAVTAFMRA